MKRLVAAVLLCLAPAAFAAPLLRPAPVGAGLIAPATEQALDIDPSALAHLRTRDTALLDAFPLGVDGAATLDLHRIEPFSPTLRIEVDTPSGVQTIPPPDVAYFGGRVAGDSQSVAFLAAAADGVHGFVVQGDQTYAFGRDATGRYRTYALRDVGASTPAPSDFCANDLHPDRSLVAPRPSGLTRRMPQAAVTSTMLEAEVAIDTDTELVGKFATQEAALSYLTGLFAAANVIYERDVQVHLKLNYLRLRTGSDPWTSGDTLGALDELQAYWTMPSNNMPNGTNDLVHLLSGKDVTGGIAYIEAACSSTYHFGVSQVFGDPDASSNTGFWDVVVFTHELGHNVGTPHSHCYSPPLDHCYGSEPGCYAGPTSVPAGGGTIMSYCHLLSGGLGNINLLFGPTVSSTIRNFVTSASCLTASIGCGDGTLGAGEQCDDGNAISGDGCSATCEIEGVCGDGTVGAGEQCDDANTTGGDGCSATCQLETVCGNGAVEGVEQCDDGNVTNGDGCSAICRIEPVCGDAVIGGSEQCDDGNTTGGDGCSPICRIEVCGDAVVDVGEQCDDGNTVSGDGCSATCVHEPLCGDGALDTGEECDDDNAVSGDGCSATCLLEPCQIVVPHQAVWAPAKLVSTPGTFALRARFGVPSDALDLQGIVDEGLQLLVDGASGARAMHVNIPSGGGWALAGTRLRYRDPSGAVSGVRSIVIRAKGDGITTVDVKIASHGGPVPDPSDGPPTVTVLLGDANAGALGACGRYAFDAAACVKRGKKLSCR